MHKINEIRIYLCLQPIKSDQLKVLLIHPTSFGFFCKYIFCLHCDFFCQTSKSKYSLLSPQSQCIFGYFHFFLQKFFGSNPISTYGLVNASKYIRASSKDCRRKRKIRGVALFLLLDIKIEFTHQSQNKKYSTTAKATIL